MSSYFRPRPQIGLALLLIDGASVFKNRFLRFKILCSKVVKIDFFVKTSHFSKLEKAKS